MIVIIMTIITNSATLQLMQFLELFPHPFHLVLLHSLLDLENFVCT